MTASARFSAPASRVALLLTTAALLIPAAVGSQARPARAPNPRADSIRTAQQLDVQGRHAEARAIFQRLIDNAPTPADRAAATRRLAMSYGYDGNCAKVIELEEQVIAYWQTRRAAEPQNAHYQEGEMANEAARVCVDHGHLDEGLRMYERGSALGNAEPAPRTHPKSLWDFRLAHARARVAARKGDTAAADRAIADARRALDSDPAMAEGQEQYFPYLVGYVALFTGDLATAEREIGKAVAEMTRDPFQVVLLGMTYERKGDEAKARELFERAYTMATGSNPPNVFSRAYTKRKLGVTDLMSDLHRDASDVERKVNALAEAIPEFVYAWRPSAGVRSVQETLLHIAADNYLIPIAMGMPAPAGSGITSDFQTAMAYEKRTMSKAEIVADVAASFRHLHEAMNLTTDLTLGEQIPFFGSQWTRQRALILTLTHLHEHLGQMIAYARANEVVPPWSR